MEKIKDSVDDMSQNEWLMKLLFELLARASRILRLLNIIQSRDLPFLFIHSGKDTLLWCSAPQKI